MQPQETAYMHCTCREGRCFSEYGTRGFFKGKGEAKIFIKKTDFLDIA